MCMTSLTFEAILFESGLNFNKVTVVIRFCTYDDINKIDLVFRISALRRSVNHFAFYMNTKDIQYQKLNFNLKCIPDDCATSKQN